MPSTDPRPHQRSCQRVLWGRDHERPVRNVRSRVLLTTSSTYMRKSAERCRMIDIPRSIF